MDEVPQGDEGQATEGTDTQEDGNSTDDEEAIGDASETLASSYIIDPETQTLGQIYKKFSTIPDKPRNLRIKSR